MNAQVETKSEIQTYRRYGMDTMHVFDTLAIEEKALCGADVPAADLTGVDDYLERLKDDLPVGNVCESCEVLAVRWAENRILKREADAGDLRTRADELERVAAEGREQDPARYRNGAERRRSEAEGLEEEAHELRKLVERLKGETGLDGPGR